MDTAVRPAITVEQPDLLPGTAPGTARATMHGVLCEPMSLYSDVRLHNGGWSHRGSALALPGVEGARPYDEEFALYAVMTSPGQPKARRSAMPLILIEEAARSKGGGRPGKN